MLRWSVTPDWIHVADKQDQPGDEAEAAYCFRYGSQWIGFAEMRRAAKSNGGVVERGTTINWELLTSRDGRHWSRPIRELFFADNSKETWRHQVFKVFANPPIQRNGKLLIYYGGKTGTVPIEKDYEPFQAMCLATLRADGFVSLTAGEEAGQLITKPFVVTGNRLLLNVAVHDAGEARVELLDEQQQTIPGFGLSNSIPIQGQSIEQTVSWRGDAKWGQLTDKRVRLRIKLRNADLYAIWTASKG